MLRRELRPPAGRPIWPKQSRRSKRPLSRSTRLKQSAAAPGATLMMFEEKVEQERRICSATSGPLPAAT